jgi:8-oxo-dGTP pyrophosphatase MutT (NUDIX family)
MTDPGDLSIADAARREMREETGYDSEDLVELGALTPNPAIQNNRIHTYLARDARRVGAQDLQGAEEIDVELVDLEAVADLVRAGRIHHALVVAAFYLLDHRR